MGESEPDRDELVGLLDLLLNDTERLLRECSLEQSLPHICAGSVYPSWQSGVLPVPYIFTEHEYLLDRL